MRGLQTTEGPKRRERDFQSALFITKSLVCKAHSKNTSKTKTYGRYVPPIVLQEKYKCGCFGGLGRTHIHVCKTMSKAERGN